MEEWKEYKLGDFMEFNPKVKLAKNTLARKITMDQLIPHCRDIHSWTFEPYTGGTKFENGDTIMARITPCLENGKHAYISCLEKDEVAYGSTEYIVIRGRKDISDNDFVYYLSHFPDFKNAAIKSMVGTSGRQRAQVDVLENLKMYLPPLSTQRQIASILSSLDDKIELNRKINANLEAQAQALFKSWFVDFEPFKDGDFQDSELGMIPKGWRVGRLDEIADITMGTSPSGTSYNTEGLGDVFYQGRAEFGFRFPSRNLFTTEAKRFADIDTVLVSVRAPVGDINVAEERCCIGRGLASVKSKNNYNSFILYLMQNLKPIFDRFNGEGTVFGSINKKSFEEMQVLIPDKRVISTFDSFASSIDCQIKRTEQESRRLASLRDALLPRLMSGELKVNDINI